MYKREKVNDGEIENARRTLAKAEEVLRRCGQYFHHQASMNAEAHLAGSVLFPPIYSSISNALQGISQFHQSYPPAERYEGGFGG